MAFEKPTFCVRKRIFNTIGTLNGSAAETIFVCAQVIEDIRCGRYPLTEEDIVMFVALRALTETGSQDVPK